MSGQGRRTSSGCCETYLTVVQEPIAMFARLRLVVAVICDSASDMITMGGKVALSKVMPGKAVML